MCNSCYRAKSAGAMIGRNAAASFGGLVSKAAILIVGDWRQGGVICVQVGLPPAEKGGDEARGNVHAYLSGMPGSLFTS